MPYETMNNTVKIVALKVEPYNITTVNHLLQYYDNIVNAQLNNETRELYVFYKEKQNSLTEN